MGDRGAEGALGLGALDVDVDPLVVAGELGELVDVLLGDRAPLARADRLPDEPADLVYAVNRDRQGPGGAAYRARGLRLRA